ncbi:MAG: TRAP transporter substrate-binding protein DctP [Xanthomonadales bacterium]|nr:TRAP transporter substrate-binding protein DctP [Gammaproteobacteria bacterium]MBT8053229.1 TRAP transporter substrate-binding protein DctP [Gammaproteobacteria bacterium]NND56821.1 TRAP transporter substrate-binding protein DctP [Xanthomonadales bacterium]NNK50269.1 TRAP transporter substrate-binding protein DctP [Xanthomonadales bacterium]
MKTLNLGKWLLVLLVATGSSTAMAQTFKIATIAPEGSSWMKDMRSGAEAIEKHTEGRVKFKFYGGGVQGNDKQVQRKMRTGQLHGGAFTSGAMNQFQRDADLFAMPMVFNTADEARFVRRQLEPVVRQRLEEAGYVNFGFAAAGFAYMMSNQPLQTLADLKGRKVWIPEGDPIGFAALRALGIAPVVMPVTDVMTGLQTDLLDSVTVPPVGAVVFQWHTRLKYITKLPVAYVYAALLIDQRAFSRASAGDQQIVREVMEGIYRKFDQNGVIDNREALQALLGNGLQMVSPDVSDIKEWRSIVYQSHRQQAESGVFDIELLDRLETLVGEYRSDQSAAAP